MGDRLDSPAQVSVRVTTGNGGGPYSGSDLSDTASGGSLDILIKVLVDQTGCLVYDLICLLEGEGI